MVTTNGVLAAYAFVVLLPMLQFATKPYLLFLSCVVFFPTTRLPDIWPRLLRSLPHQIHYVSQPCWRPARISPRSNFLNYLPSPDWREEERKWETLKFYSSCRSFLVFTLAILVIYLVLSESVRWCHVWSPSSSPSGWSAEKQQNRVWVSDSLLKNRWLKESILFLHFFLQISSINEMICGL